MRGLVYTPRQTFQDTFHHALGLVFKDQPERKTVYAEINSVWRKDPTFKIWTTNSYSFTRYSALKIGICTCNQRRSQTSRYTSGSRRDVTHVWWPPELMAEASASESDSDVDERLHLSCESSDFEESQDHATEGIAPYQFEPYASSSDGDVESATEEDDRSSRLESLTW